MKTESGDRNADGTKVPTKSYKLNILQYFSYPSLPPSFANLRSQNFETILNPVILIDFDSSIKVSRVRWHVSESATDCATFCQALDIFTAIHAISRSVPSMPVGKSALKSPGHVLAVPSHASRGACCHCRYLQSRNDHAHASIGSSGHRTPSDRSLSGSPALKGLSKAPKLDRRSGESSRRIDHVDDAASPSVLVVCLSLTIIQPYGP